MCNRHCKSLQQSAAVCSGLQWFAARPPRGGHRHPGAPQKAPPARAGGILFGGGGPGVSSPAGSRTCPGPVAQLL
eukprot:3211970-Alexandrium_andersonii.AAC.1